MSRFGQYGNFYDPIGSQAKQQPTAYNHQNNPSSSAYQSAPPSSASWGSGYPNYPNVQYAGAQYGTPVSPAHDVNSTNNTGFGSSNTFTSNNTNQQQASNTDLYFNTHGATQPAPNNTSAFTPTNTFQSNNARGGNSTGTYQAPYAHVAQQNQQQQHGIAQQQPTRYQSPIQAIQASTNNHDWQPSQNTTRSTSPRVTKMTQSASQQPTSGWTAYSSMATVNPSHVYDNRAALQRQAQAEADKRRKRELEDAAKKVDQEPVAAEERRAEEERRPEAGRQAQDEKQKVERDAAKKKERQQRRAEKRRKATEEKRRSATAATALQQLSSGVDASTSELPSGSQAAVDTEEEEMRAMFKKMREFNSKNPAMLAKLWEEERKSHKKSSQTITRSPAPAVQVPHPPPPQSTPVAKTAPKPQSSQRGPKPKASGTTSKAVITSVPETRPVPSPALPPAKSAAPSGLMTSVPNHTKEILAAAAAKWLLSLPQNAGKPITKEALEKMLDSNPPYVQLCEMLERNGWGFDRSALARELLRAAPDATKTLPPSRSTAALQNINNSVPGAHDGPLNVTLEVVQSNMPSARDDRLQRAGDYSAPYGTTHAPLHGQALLNLHTSPNIIGTERQSAEVKPKNITPDIDPEEPRRPPADKEEAARKRNFNDLVDLTRADSDDDEMPPKKIMVTEQASHPGANPGLLDQAHSQQQTLWQPLAYANFMRRTPALSLPGPGDPMPPVPPRMQPPPTMHGQTGMYLPSQPQPAPVPRPPKSRGPTQEQVQTQRMRGKMLVEPLMRDRVARKSTYDSGTIARDILLATGRHPDMRGLNFHMAAMQKLLGDHGGQSDGEGRINLKCDLATIKWSIIDPGEPHESGQKSAKAESHEVVPEDENSAPSNLTDFTRHPQFSPSTPSSAIQRRRGRPPKTKGLTNNLGVASTRLSPNSQPPGSGESAPARAANDMSGSVGYAAFAQRDATGAKKKGRPFGWRKSIHSRAAQGLPPKTAPSQSQAGRPRQSATSTQVEPQYQVYQCQWRKCGAELHNLDTLKKHVTKIHARNPEEDAYVCRWQNCDSSPFHEATPWMEHVDQQHLQPIAWKLGDGPRGGSLGDYTCDPDVYLSDSRGRSITPVISPTSPPIAFDREGVGLKGNRIQWPKRVGRPPGPGDERTMMESLQELEQHKIAVGSILDRQGCILASEDRRITFLEDEDFEDEVSGSEHELDMRIHDFSHVILT